jgi:hypothetical protein
MPSKTGRTFGLLLLAVSGLALLPSAAGAGARTSEGNTEAIGPWEIEAAYIGDKFDRCTISRKLDDDIIATFMRTGEGLALLLSSPNWKLERGKQYPVTMTLGAQSWDREVAAEANSVSMEVDDAKFERSLKSANVLNVVAAGATIRVPLDSSTAALDRLDGCVEKNERAVQTNPFVVPARRP